MKISSVSNNDVFYSKSKIVYPDAYWNVHKSGLQKTHEMLIKADKVAIKEAKAGLVKKGITASCFGVGIADIAMGFSAANKGYHVIGAITATYGAMTISLGNILRKLK